MLQVGAWSHLHVPLVHGYRVVRLLKIAVWWYEASLKCQSRFDHRNNATRSFCVANIRFDRPDKQWLTRSPSLSKDGVQCSGFKRITDFGSRAVSLDKSCQGRVYPCLFIDLTNQCLLCLPIWCCNTSGPSILVEATVDNYRSDGVSSRLGVLERFQYNTTSTFTSAKASAAVIEWV